MLFRSVDAIVETVFCSDLMILVKPDSESLNVPDHSFPQRAVCLWKPQMTQAEEDTLTGYILYTVRQFPTNFT